MKQKKINEPHHQDNKNNKKCHPSQVSSNTNLKPNRWDGSLTRVLRYYIKTLGCQMNSADSNLISDYFTSIGFESTDNPGKTNIVVINTCTVRQHAEERALSEIGKFKEWKSTFAKATVDKQWKKHEKNEILRFAQNDKLLKTRNDIKILIVIGCVVERIGTEVIKKKFPYVDICIGAKSIPEFKHHLFSNKKFKVLVEESDKNTELKVGKMDSCLRRNDNQNQVSTFVTIMRGCNNYCSYCIVPYVRGKEESRDFTNILDEIQCLVNHGVKEITLLGQNVNSYKYVNCQSTTSSDKAISSLKPKTMRLPRPSFHSGLAMTNTEFTDNLNKYKNEKLKIIDFADLLYKINEIPGLLRIRFMTNHPKDVPDKVIDAIANIDKVCKHLHLPLQSGSNNILEKMNRKYSREQYIELVNKLRKKVPWISITTDVLVGFPGESEQDFKDTVDIIKKIQFDFAYVFKYSTREKTKASKLVDDIPKETKEKRHKILLDLCNKIAQEKNSTFINKKLDILVEKIYNKDNNKIELFGKTIHNRPVTIFTDRCNTKNLVGKIIPVKIIQAKVHSLIGEIEKL